MPEINQNKNMNTTQSQNSTATAGGHTPGPWIIDRLNEKSVRELSIYSEAHYLNVGICTIDLSFHQQQLPGEYQANARLIAQCPSMYDYIAKRATLGDVDAIKIIDSLR